LDFSIMKLLLTCFSAFALFCHVHAGFCDGKSGKYCRYKDGFLVSTWCSCKYKRRRFLSKYKGGKYKGYKSKIKYSGSSLKRDCDSVEDRRCFNGCSGCTSGCSGVCLAASQVCATITLDNVDYNDGQKIHKLTTTCPMVTKFPYKTWKDRQLNSDAKELGYLRDTVNANNAWSKAVLLPKFYANATKGVSTVAAVNAAWDANCKATDMQQMNCRTYFPKCLYNRGDNSECMTYCSKAMECVRKVRAACVDANKKDPSNCKQFAAFGPRAGSDNCADLCREYQNDYVADAGSTLGSFMSVAIAFAITFIM